MMIQYPLFDYKIYKPNKISVSRETKSHKKASLLADYVVLDTETSHNHNKDNPIGWIYQWAFMFNNEIVYGRKPTELCTTLHNICDVNNCNENVKLVCYVHNLPYDFTYLVQYLEHEFGKPIKVFATAPHKLFSIEYEQIIFKCTYKLSNKSLDKWSKDLMTKHKKLVGTVDYNVIRYQDTRLNKKDWRYMFYDIIVLRECIELQMKSYNDDILTIPLTSTGYVRREIRNAYRAEKQEFKNFQKAKLCNGAYIAYRNEFSGGITHGNRFYKNKTINIDMIKSIDNNATYIRHRDFVSHYPSQQRVNQFPMGKTMLYYRLNPNNILSIKDIFDLSKKYCVQVKIKIDNLTLKSNKITLPYAQSSHFKRQYSSGTHFIEDNGRILKYNGPCIVYLNEIDLYWINRQYNFEYVIYEVYITRKGQLPPFMINTIDEHFKAKTDLKNKVKILKQEKADILTIHNADIDLMKSKNLLNGIYGCSATDIVREELELNGIDWNKINITSKYITDSIDKYYKSRNNYNRYEWGCYTTSYARHELMQLYELIGNEYFIYCDTDSIFYISTPEIEQKILQWNLEKRLLADNNDYYVIDDNGNKIYYNQFEDEKEDITVFRFLHSKCYAYIYDEQLHCTIAGVTQFSSNKHVSRETELKDINNLHNGYTFTRCGGTTCKYTNTTMSIMNIDGHITEVGTAAIIERTTKTLNSNDEYVDYYKYEIVN